MKTIHNMNLNNGPFNRIIDGTKTIELRLNDENGVIGIEVRVIEDKK